MGPVEKRLRTARSRLVEGWCQNRLRSGSKVCLVGSILPDDAVSMQSRYILGEVVFGNRDRYQIATWNDDAHRKKAHVLAAVGFAIAIAKRRGL